MKQTSEIHVPVLIVGAGPAGCAAAYDLAAAGIQVMMIDKAEFPRLKPCAGGLTVKTVRALRYPVAPVVRRTCESMRISNDGRGQRLLRAGTPVVAMTVRSEFDQYCLEKTLAAGGSLRRVGSISALEKTADGWRLTTRELDIHCRFLIGADGANSRVRALAFPQNPVCFGMAAEAEVPCEKAGEIPMTFDFGAVDRGYGWVFPKGDHLNVGLYSLDQFPIKERLREYCRTRLGVPLETRIVGHRIPHGGHDLVPYRDNLMLVGDAAGLIDPLMGEGLYNAVRSGQIAAEAVIQTLEVGDNPFARTVGEVLDDIRWYRPHTDWFYGHLGMGYRLLTLPLVGKALMKGFALGWNVTTIRRRLWHLPFTRVDLGLLSKLDSGRPVL